MRLPLGSTALILLGCASPANGQALADRILSAPDGVVRLAYNVREGICGDGETFIRDRAAGENHFIRFESPPRSGRDWRDRPCVPGPARVAITRSGGEITRVRVYVGGRWDVSSGALTDLGQVAAPLAAKALLSVARTSRKTDDALLGAMLADSAQVWPDLLDLAKDPRVPENNRKSAVFWLSQIAGDAATKGLTDLAEDESEDRGIRDQAVFALSQLPAEQGVPVLIRLARSHMDPKVRRKAIFWLGQSDDPRALALFEEILIKGN